MPTTLTPQEPTPQIPPHHLNPPDIHPPQPIPHPAPPQPIPQPPTPQQLTPQQLYDLIQQYAGLLPIPAPYVTINVGTYNAATGAWTGLTTRVITDPEPIEHEPGQHPVNPPPRFAGAEYVEISISPQWRRTSRLIPAPIVGLAPALVQFTVVNATVPWSVTVNGYTQSAPAGQTTVTLNVWDRTAVDWTLQVGGASHSDSLMVQRTGSLPVFGAFTIPMMPLAIVYAPPADSQQKSTASFGQSDTIGTTVSWDFSTDNSQTNPSQFTDGPSFGAFVSTVASVLSLAGGGGSSPEATAGKDLNSIGSLFPSFSGTVQSGTIVDNGGSITNVMTQSSTAGTTAKGGGPGAGDTIMFFKDIQVAWAYADNQWQLFPFSWSLELYTAAFLGTNFAQVGLSSADQQVLLSLDPFVAGGPFVTPPSGRFTLPPGAPLSIGYGGGSTYVQTFTTTNDTKTTATTTSYTTDANSWNPGPLLEAFGVGATKNQTTTKLTNAQGTDVSQTATLNVSLVSGPTDNFSITIWYDNLFGTWAFQQLPPAAQALVSGQGAQPGEVVQLVAGGGTHVAVADSNGDFEFWSSTIPAGSAQLMVQGKPAQTVQVG